MFPARQPSYNMLFFFLAGIFTASFKCLPAGGPHLEQGSDTAGISLRYTVRSTNQGWIGSAIMISFSFNWPKPGQLDVMESLLATSGTFSYYPLDKESMFLPNLSSCCGAWELLKPSVSLGMTSMMWPQWLMERGKSWSTMLLAVD